MGAHFRLPVVEATWPEITSFCQDLTIYAASVDSDLDYTAVDWQGEWALIMGNEAQGVSRKALSVAQNVISIPMADATESLNVASAAAVLLFEARRQLRRANNS